MSVVNKHVSPAAPAAAGELAARPGARANVVVVGDSSGNDALLNEILRSHPEFELSFERLSDVGDLAHCEHGAGRPDALLLDLERLDGSGADILADASKLLPDVPIVVLGSMDNGAAADCAVRHSHQDFIDKTAIDARDLGHRLSSAIARNQRAQRFFHLANFDGLTGLANRNLFGDRLAQTLLRRTRDQQLTALMFVDIDDFKRVNDSCGHDVGDALLQATATQLKNAVRQSDTVARLGGDEFAVLLEDVGYAGAAAEVAQKVLAAAREPIVIGDHEFTNRLSIGIALHRPGMPVPTPDAFLKQADTALYQAKQAGKDTVRSFTAALDRAARARDSFEQDLALARERDELEVWYQPIVDPRDQGLRRVEALLRWNHPKRGVVLPDQFLPAMTRLGILEKSCLHAVRLALRQYQCWQAAGLAPVPLACNVDARELDQENYASVLESLLAETSFDPRSLQLELTEHSLLHESRQVRANLERVRALGIALIIDDFGMGYGSFVYLKRLVVDGIKIDRTITAGLPDNRSDRAISHALIRLANDAGLSITAEGVENLGQLATLQRLEVDFVQGFLISRPLSAAAFARRYQLPGVAALPPRPTHSEQARHDPGR